MIVLAMVSTFVVINGLIPDQWVISGIITFALCVGFHAMDDQVDKQRRTGKYKNELDY